MTIKEHMNQVLSSGLRQYAFWLLLFLLCLVLHIFMSQALLRFERVLIEQGQVWRLLTGHLVHLNWNHLWLNMGGLAIVALFFGRYLPVTRWLYAMLVSTVFVSAGLYWLNPEIVAYVGLSGVLHGLFIVGAWQERQRYPASAYLLLVLLVIKLLWEQLSGALPGSESLTGGHVVVDSHLYGAIGGGVYLLLHQVIHVNDRQQDGQHDE